MTDAADKGLPIHELLPMYAKSATMIGQTS